MIYLDSAATTKCCDEVVEEIIKYNKELFFNPSSTNSYSIKIHNQIEETKKFFAKQLGIPFNKNVIFTGCATEANNIAIQGLINNRTKQIVISEGEHPSVYNLGKALLEKGYDVKFIKLSRDGQIDYEELENVLEKGETSIISVMMVNNETGAINDLKRISLLRDKYCKNAIFHSDCVQAFGKIALNFYQLGVDIITFSAHKIGGPKGVGCLCFNNKVKLKPIIFGGGQEYNIRSGTENVGSIMAFKKASEMALLSIKENYNKIAELKKIFLENLSGINFESNSKNENSPYILSLSMSGIRGETLINMLYEKDIITSSGSACSSRKIGNRILQSMGINNIIGSIRISFSPKNNLEEIIEASKQIKECYKILFEKTH